MSDDPRKVRIINYVAPGGAGVYLQDVDDPDQVEPVATLQANEIQGPDQLLQWLTVTQLADVSRQLKRLADAAERAEQKQAPNPEEALKMTTELMDRMGLGDQLRQLLGNKT